ncbi:MAG: hypothetical protein M3Y82_01965, partial [Verrucomicrobiota bacterium]|nr:hypothetical protein [Verrucomicrobiota bacterium]
MKTFTQNLNLKSQNFILLAGLFALLGFGSPAQAVPLNDNNFGGFNVATSGSAMTTVTGSNVGATRQAGEPFHYSNFGGKSVWWKWTPSLSGTATVSTRNSDFDTILAVYTGNLINNLSLIANNDDYGGFFLFSQVTFPAVAGVQYEIAVDGSGTGASISEGNVVLNVSIAPFSPPSNDNFASRITVTTSGNAVTTVTGSNVNATKEIGEPQIHLGSGGAKSVWWKWTAPLTGTATINTTNSNFDTIMAVYTGFSVGSLTTMAENDNYPGFGDQSQVTFPAVAGTEYEIAVDGFGSYEYASEGNVSLNVSMVPLPPPVNDNFASRIAITTTGSAVTTVTGSNANATKEIGEPLHFSPYGGKSVWWKWTAPIAGTATINTTNSSFDTILAIYINGLTLVTNNDDYPGFGGRSQVTFPAATGMEYEIAVDGFGIDPAVREGNITLNVNISSPPSLGINSSLGNIRLSLAGQVGSSYRVEYKNNLNSTSWTTLT